MNKVTVGGKKRSGGRLKVLELEFVFVLAAEIIHVLDSIVRCASSNVFIVFFWQCFFTEFDLVFDRFCALLVLFVCRSSTT